MKGTRPLPLLETYTPVRVRARSPRSAIATATAVFIAAMFHIAIVASVLLSESGRLPHVPREKGLAANAVSADTEATATLILIEEPDAQASKNSSERLASHGPVLQNLRLTLISPEPTIDLRLENEADTGREAAQDSAADVHSAAALFGLYLNQIQARVRRAWMRPRAPIGAESFECRVQVLQSARGEVKEVTLQDCNGDTRWQLSLVHAIERASPFPAPPDPKVFAETLRLSFSSYGYGAGSNEDEFEPMSLQTAQATGLGR